MKNLLGHFVEAVQAPAAARKNKAGRNLFQQTGALQVVANQRDEFLRARFDNFRQHPRENRPRRPIANAGDFDRRVLLQKCRGSAAIAALDAFGFRNRRAQADGEIVREMIAANCDSAGVANHATAVDDDFRRPTADVEEAAAHIAFILRETGVGRSERFKNSVADQDSRAIRGRDKVLRGNNRRRDDVYVRFQMLADHADGVANAVVRIHNEFVRQNVEHFAVFGAMTKGRDLQVPGFDDLTGAEIMRAANFAAIFIAATMAPPGIEPPLELR